MPNQAIRYFLTSIFILNFAPTALFAGGEHEDDGEAHQHTSGEHSEEGVRGPHGGRLLTRGDFSLEYTIHEAGEVPQLRVYAFWKGRLLLPESKSIRIELVRFGGRREVFELKPVNNYFASDTTVEEPHSFDVSVFARYAGHEYTWQFPSYEGRTELGDEALKVANILIEKAAPQDISSVAAVYGRLVPHQDRVAHISPRFTGIVRSMHKELGDIVKKGELLAVIESNQSLQPYEIRAPLSGELVARHATVGELAKDDREILTVADLSEIWAEFQVYRDDFDSIQKGQSITVELGQQDPIEATVRYVAPVIDEATQSKLVRALIANPLGRYKPGLFVTGTLSGNKTPVPVAVKREAVQSFRDWNVVYLTDGHVFQAMPVQLGRKDSRYVEILSGLSPGDQYVSKNSFIIKADIEKSGASHDH